MLSKSLHPIPTALDFVPAEFVGFATEIKALPSWNTCMSISSMNPQHLKPAANWTQMLLAWNHRNWSLVYLLNQLGLIVSKYLRAQSYSNENDDTSSENYWRSTRSHCFPNGNNLDNITFLPTSTYTFVCGFYYSYEYIEKAWKIRLELHLKPFEILVPQIFQPTYDWKMLNQQNIPIHQLEHIHTFSHIRLQLVEM